MYRDTHADQFHTFRMSRSFEQEGEKECFHLFAFERREKSRTFIHRVQAIVRCVLSSEYRLNNERTYTLTHIQTQAEQQAQQKRREDLLQSCQLMIPFYSLPILSLPVCNKTHIHAHVYMSCTAQAVKFFSF